MKNVRVISANRVLLTFFVMLIAGQFINQTAVRGEASVDDLLSQAKDFVDQEKYDQADPLYEKAVELNPNIGEVHYRYSLNLAKQNRLYRALDEAEIAYRLEPKQSKYAEAVGESLVGTGEWLKAANHYEQCLKVFPDDAYLASQAAYCYRDEGNRSKSIEMFNRLLHMPHDGTVEWADCARVLMADSKYDEALKLLEESRSKLGQDEQVNAMIAWLTSRKTRKPHESMKSRGATTK